MPDLNYVVSAPTPNAGLLSNAMSAVQQIGGNTTTDQVAKSTAATADSTLGKSNPYAATATNAGLNNINVGTNSTVAGQLSNIMDVKNPLMQQAETQGLQAANSRGLLNSTMGVQAGQSALYDKALQIATPDAATYAAANTNNAQMANQNSMFNAQNNTNVDLSNTAAKNQSSQFNAASANALQSQNLSNQQQTNLTNAQSFNTALQNDSQSSMQAKISNQSTNNAVVMQNLDAAFKASVTNADNATKLQLQDMQNETQKRLAEIQATSQEAMQRTSSASQLYQQTVKDITATISDPNMDADAKNVATANQTQMLQDGMSMLGQLSNLGVSSLLKF